MIEVGINGIAGRMGQTILETAGEREDVAVTFGIYADDANLSVPVYDPNKIETALTKHAPDVIIDFSVPEATTALAPACSETGVGLVVGTTGFEEEGFAVLSETSESVPLLKATNFSRGIQALLRTIGPALKALSSYDLEVIETHHNAKRDAPSGTAKTILEEIGDYREFDTVPGREGIQPREEEEVGMLVRRAGDIRGEHEITIANNNEVLTLAHRVEDRAVFAAGALDAAVWLAGREAGRYDFGEVISDD